MLYSISKSVIDSHSLFQRAYSPKQSLEDDPVAEDDPIAEDDAVAKDDPVTEDDPITKDDSVAEDDSVAKDDSVGDRSRSRRSSGHCAYELAAADQNAVAFHADH